MDERRFHCSLSARLAWPGLRIVLRAGKILKGKGRHDVKFMLVGDGAHRVQLEQEVRKPRLDNIIFTGRLDKSQVPLIWLALMHAFVHLRKHELFKTVLPSKMFGQSAMGKPILLGVGDAPGTFCAAHNAGIAFEPKTPPPWCGDRDSRNDPAKARQLGADGRRYVCATSIVTDLAGIISTLLPSDVRIAGRNLGADFA